MRHAIFSLIACALLANKASAAKIDKLDQVDDSKNLSQLIRSNTGNYWSFARKNAGDQKIAAYLQHKGIAAGDPHPGNFSIIPIRSASGSVALQYLNIDFDDAGRAPLALDFARLVVACEAMDSNLKKRDLEKAYLAGLKGKRRAAPESVEMALKTPISSYEARVDKYVAKKTAGEKFKLEEGEIEQYKGRRISRAEIEKLFPKLRVVDVASRPQDRGGSAGLLRLWILARSSDDSLRIFELKEWKKTELEKYEAQPEPEQWLSEVRAAFWPGISTENYRLVEIPGAGLFWLREKKVSLIDIPYSGDDKDDVRFRAEYSEYVANYLGLLHGKQSAGLRLLKQIEDDTDAFHEAVDEFASLYLKLVKKAAGN